MDEVSIDKNDEYQVENGYSDREDVIHARGPFTKDQAGERTSVVLELAAGSKEEGGISEQN